MVNKVKTNKSGTIIDIEVDPDSPEFKKAIEESLIWTPKKHKKVKKMFKKMLKKYDNFK